MRGMQKVWNSICYFTNISWKSREGKQDSLDFRRMCGSLLEIRVKIGIFAQKPWKSRTIVYQEKSGNPTSSMGEGQSFYGIAHSMTEQVAKAFRELCFPQFDTKFITPQR